MVVVSPDVFSLYVSWSVFVLSKAPVEVVTLSGTSTVAGASVPVKAPLLMVVTVPPPTVVGISTTSALPLKPVMVTSSPLLVYVSWLALSPKAAVVVVTPSGTTMVCESLKTGLFASPLLMVVTSLPPTVAGISTTPLVLPA